MSILRMRRLALLAPIAALALTGTAAAGGAGGRAQTDAKLPGSIAYSAGSQHAAVPFQVYVARPDGTITQATHAAVRHAFPAPPEWSPDGSRVLVSADDGLYVVRADGSSEIRVSSASAYYPVGAMWSPDSRRIAYRDGSSLYIVDVDGSADPRILSGRLSDSYRAWSWSPDGSQIVYAGTDAHKRSGLFLVTTQGTPKRKQIEIRPRPSNPPGARAYHASSYRVATWSPDGSRIAFQWDDGRAKCCVNDWIYVMKADGSGVTRIHRGNIRAWSPDGKKLAFAEGIINDYSLSIVDASGTDLQKLRCEHACGSPSWFRDGSRLVYTTHDGQEIVVARSGGSDRRIVVGPVRGGGYSLSPDGSAIAYVAGKSRDRGSSLYVVRSDGSGRRLVVRSSTLRFSSPAWRPISHARARDANHEGSTS